MSARGAHLMRGPNAHRSRTRAGAPPQEPAGGAGATPGIPPPPDEPASPAHAPPPEAPAHAPAHAPALSPEQEPAADGGASQLEPTVWTRGVRFGEARHQGPDYALRVDARRSRGAHRRRGRRWRAAHTIRVDARPTAAADAAAAHCAAAHVRLDAAARRACGRHGAAAFAPRVDGARADGAACIAPRPRLSTSTSASPARPTRHWPSARWPAPRRSEPCTPTSSASHAGPRTQRRSAPPHGGATTLTSRQTSSTPRTSRSPASSSASTTQ